MSISSQLLYAALFQIGWFICVYLGNLAAIAFALMFILFYFGQIRSRQSGGKNLHELYWLVSVSGTGFAMETLFFSVGILYGDRVPGLFAGFELPPTWLLALWFCFAIALRTCLRFIFHYPLLSYPLFALAVPASYWAGTSLNQSVHINKPYFLSLILITLTWMMFIGYLHWLRRRYFEDEFDDR